MIPEQLLFLLLLFLVIAVVNFLGQVLRRGARRAEPEQRRPRPERGAGPEPTSRARTPGGLQAREAPRQTPRPPRAPAAPGQRRARPRLNAADLRRGVVLMAILEPSRALEPPARGR